MVKIMPRKKTQYAKVNLNQSPTRPACASVEQTDHLLNDDETQYPYLNNLCPPRHLKILKNQNQYLQEWLSHQQRYLSILLDMETPPAPWICMSCGGDGIYRVQQWNGTFFEESFLRLAGIMIHLGHAGQPCPTGGDFTQEVTTDDEDEWEDVEEDRGPTHLRSPKDRSCLVVHTNGIHYCNVKYYTCMGAEDSHLQLTMAGLFPATTKQPRTAFTFHVLDDFIRDNVECGTSAMNYYSKLQRITSNGFPHLVPDRSRELLQVSRMWRLLKLLKWQGLHTSPKDAGPGELVLFCLACLQPGVNIPKEGIDLSQWTFARTLVMDGNFKAEHMHPTDPNNEVWLMDGKGFMVESMPYKEYLKGSTNVVEHLLASVVVPVQGMGAMYLMQCKNLACWLKVNQFISMPAGLTIQPSIGLWHMHGHQTEFFVQYAPNFIPGVALSLNKKIKGAQWSCAAAEEAFAALDNNVLDAIWQVWIDQAERAFAEQASKPEAMDIFEVQLEKAPTAKLIEMNLIYSQGPSQHWGSATWIARALKIEQAQVQLIMDSWRTDTRSQINSLIESAVKVIMDDWDDLFHQAPLTLSGGGDANSDVFMLTQLELELRQGQANDCLHELQLALANKAVIFCTDIRHGRNYKLTTQAWGKIATVEAGIQWHVAMYGARPDILDQYKELNRSDLKVSTAVTDLNARGHRDDTLAWFWTMDVPQDTAASDWMSEFYYVNWLRTKALCEQWKEEPSSVRCMADWATLSKNWQFNMMEIGDPYSVGCCYTIANIL
ncbi:hypothetical protein J3A83DRAFT_4190533 [Scleroderma citrinum]